MRACLLIVAACLLPLSVRAEVSPVEVRVPEGDTWVGQRLPVFIDLRAEGSFGGGTEFSTPRIPGGFLMKVGSPTVSSSELEGATWFVQTHEFAFYSQRDGSVEIPAFEVRFGTREGFTGPVTERRETVPATTVTIRRPDGTDPDAFLVTTDSYELSEEWDPAPGPAPTGAIFKRTIIQRANDIPGMALPPAPQTAPDGVKVYPSDASTADRTNRGALSGERREIVTYQMREPGTHSLPAITFQWWNPRSQKLESRSLPAATFEIAPAPSSTIPPDQAAPRGKWAVWLASILLCALAAFLLRSRLAAAIAWSGHRLRPKDRVAARRLRRACRRDDARGAMAAWLEWKAATSDDARAESPELHDALLSLQRHLFGPPPATAWQPAVLATAFHAHLVSKPRCSPSSRGSLPPLNPTCPPMRPPRPRMGS